MISIATAITLTGWSKRTLWRRISDGTLTRENGTVSEENKAKIHLDTIKLHLCIPLDPEDFDLIESADAGETEAQTDLALLFMVNKKPANAIYWLELAVKRNNANAMYLLGRCYTDGIGIGKNENLGIMWIAKAASNGHIMAKGQMQVIHDRFTGNH